jgi:hypothetical protein
MVFNKPLSNNGRLIMRLSHATSHCSILKAVRPEQPNGLSPFEPLPSFLWLVFYLFLYFSCGISFSTATTGLFLRALVPSDSLLRFLSQSRCITIMQSFFNGGAKLSKWPALPHIRLLLRVRRLFYTSEVVNPSPVSNSCLSVSQHTTWQTASRSAV